ncbi:MAG: FAD-binding domain-containing protein [Rhizobium sp.]|nr:FAD-binding domain-containing protein [Rhizobium sp.]
MDTASSPSIAYGFPLSRAAALERLRDFVPAAGAHYARLRNIDRGPGDHQHVSRLSAALRRRLISEDEVISVVLEYHGAAGAEKFVSEVFWRTYWKGWLEQRPSVWLDYLQAVAREAALLDRNPDLARRYLEAVEGRSGIDCFDAWTAELHDTGYLHNWARMQFASIWIFTLSLPWELGAAHMLRRLMDGDPASNTLSWRWVAGLHTVGKTYLADPERIRAMTHGRFSAQGLARKALVPADSIVVPTASTPRAAIRPEPGVPSLLLLTVEDLSLDTLPLADTLLVTALAFLPGESETDRIALSDGLERAGQRWPDAAALGALTADDLSAARALGCQQIVTGFVPVGPIADRLASLRAAAAADGLRLAEHRRGWDARAWPHCRKGFFALKEKIPMLLAASGDAS